jgi:hypothetical protein
MSSTALERPLPEAGDLSAAPVIDMMDRRKWELVKKTVAKGANDSEAAMFLELAAKYDLDPFAHEVWCAKGQGSDGGEGRLLIMVGRDGLRKIAQRNNIHIDGDVVHAADEFQVVRSSDGNRTVAHAWSSGDRGAIVGAWAECREGGPTGRPLGFFYALMSEYKPTNAKKLQYSPWGSQESVMILAAAERQALRQATPLSGLLVEGESEINEEKALGQGDAAASREALLDAILDHVPEALQDRAKDLIDEMNALAPGSWSPAKIEMIFKGSTKYAASNELSAIERAIEELQATDPRAETSDGDAAEPEEAEVVDGDPGEDAVKRRVADLKEALDGEELNEQQAADARAELDALEGELPPDEQQPLL